MLPCLRAPLQLFHTVFYSGNKPPAPANIKTNKTLTRPPVLVYSCPPGSGWISLQTPLNNATGRLQKCLKKVTTTNLFFIWLIVLIWFAGIDNEVRNNNLLACYLGNNPK